MAKVRERVEAEFENIERVVAEGIQKTMLSFRRDINISIDELLSS